MSEIVRLAKLGPLAHKFARASKNALQQKSNIGTKLWCAKVATNTTVDGDTSHLTTVTEQHFDAVRLLFWNAHTDTCTLNASVAPSASLTSKNTPTGSWVAVTKDGSATITLPAGNATNPSLTATDWVEVHSLARSDSGVFPVIMLRVYSASGQTITLASPGVSVSNWETRTDGRILAMYRQTGDFTTTNHASFTSTTFVSSSQVAGFQYLARGQVITVMGVGESVTAGATGPTYIHEGFVGKAAWSVSDIDQIAVEFCNLGWGGQNSTQYAARLNTAIATIRPTIAVLAGYTANTGTNATAANTDRFSLAKMLRDCGENHVLPIILNGIPRNSISDDSARNAFNAELAARYGNYALVDIDAVVTDGNNPADLAALYDNGDGVHPNEAGHVAMAQPLAAVLRAMLNYNGV